MLGNGGLTKFCTKITELLDNQKQKITKVIITQIKDYLSLFWSNMKLTDFLMLNIGDSWLW